MCFHFFGQVVEDKETSYLGKDRSVGQFAPGERPDGMAAKDLVRCRSVGSIFGGWIYLSSCCFDSDPPWSFLNKKNLPWKCEKWFFGIYSVWMFTLTWWTLGKISLFFGVIFLHFETSPRKIEKLSWQNWTDEAIFLTSGVLDRIKMRLEGQGTYAVSWQQRESLDSEVIDPIGIHEHLYICHMPLHLHMSICM